jgi:hypothetical protein
MSYSIATFSSPLFNFEPIVPAFNQTIFPLFAAPEPKANGRSNLFLPQEDCFINSKFTNGQKKDFLPIAIEDNRG